MKTKYTLFRRGGIYYSQDSATGQQKSLRTREEAEALQLFNARNESLRQPVLNLHLARAYLTASDPAFVERTWQVVIRRADCVHCASGVFYPVSAAGNGLGQSSAGSNSAGSSLNDF